MIESAPQFSTSLAASTGSVALSIADTIVHLLPHRAAYWPDTNTLIIADLHLGKEEVGRTMGLPLPQSLIDEPLRRLAAAITLTNAARVLIVGDLLHNRTGLTTSFIDHVAVWRSTITAQIAVIPGNHDRSLHTIANAWQLTITPPTIREGPFTFTHIPPGEPGCDDSAEAHAIFASTSFCWSGHIHPAVALPGRVPVKLPCFAISTRLGILPAFTPFASGLGLRTDGAQLYAIANDTVIACPTSQRRLGMPVSGSLSASSQPLPRKITPASNLP